MAEENKTYKPRPINYRRGVDTPLWQIAAYLCLKRGVKFNQLIDFLLMQEYKREKTG